MLNNMFAEIYPSTKCNLRCKFCYLSKDELSDPTIYKFSDYKPLLDEQFKQQTFDRIVILGGEPSLLPEDILKEYLNELPSYNVPVALISNNTKVMRFLKNYPSIKLMLSYYPYNKDFKKNLLSYLSVTKNIQVMVHVKWVSQIKDFCDSLGVPVETTLLIAETAYNEIGSILDENHDFKKNTPNALITMFINGGVSYYTDRVTSAYQYLNLRSSV